jgi:dipeptidyl aminopeptidase/acylaminoacyl peptidase
MALARFFLATVVLLAGSAGAPPGASPMRGRLLFYGFDKLFFGQLHDKTTVLEPFLPRSRITNILDASVAGDRVAVVGIDPATRAFYIFALNLRSGDIDRRLSKDAQTVAVAPGGRLVAFTSYERDQTSEFYDIGIWDPAYAEALSLVQEQATKETALSWYPDGQLLTFDSKDGWIQSVGLKTRKVTRLLEGAAPAWSPDGKKLAYQRGKSVFVYDPATRESRSLYKRGFWQTEFIGPISWSPKGDYLTANVTAGLTEKELGCIVVDVTSGVARSVYKGPYWCGPWLSQ